MHVTCIAEEKNSYMIFVFKTLKKETHGRPKPDGNTTLKTVVAEYSCQYNLTANNSVTC